jgi:hypothetical protein
MFRPITKPADIAHEIPETWILMIRNEIAHSVIPVEGRENRDRGNHDADQPVKKGAVLHNKVPVNNSYLALAPALAPNRYN